MVDTIKSSINYDRFEILKAGFSFWPSLSVVGGGASGWASGEATTTVAHGLGFTPIIVAYVQENGVTSTFNYSCPNFSFIGLGSGGLWIDLTVGVDGTNIYITTDIMTYGVTGTSSLLGGSSGGYICSYYLLQEHVKRA